MDSYLEVTKMQIEIDDLAQRKLYSKALKCRLSPNNQHSEKNHACNIHFEEDPRWLVQIETLFNSSCLDLNLLLSILLLSMSR